MGAAFSRTEAGFAPLLAGEVHFTSVFEESIFTTVPAGIAVIAALLRVLSIRGEKQVVDFGSLLWGKVALGVTHTAASLACVVLWAVLPAAQADLTLPAAIFAAGGSLSLVLLLFIEHVYSYRSSTFLSLFLSVTFLVDIAKAYACLDRGGLGPICALYMIGCVVRFLLLISQEISKRHLIRDEALRINLGSEPASGFWNRSMFVWINSTLLLGFRQALKVEDLPALDPDFKSKTVFAAFKHQWDKVDKASNYALAKACILSQAVPFATAMVPRACLTGFTFAQPFLLLHVARAVKQGSVTKNVVDSLVTATTLIYFGIAVTGTLSMHYSNQIATRLRGMLTSAIYDKMLRLSYEQLSESTAITLISTDLSGLEKIVPQLPSMLISLIEIGLGLTILSTMLGSSCVLIIIPNLITTIGSGIVSKKMARARTLWNEKIEERVAQTSNIVTQMKIIKMAGLSEPVAGFLQRLRINEVQTSMTERKFRTGITFFGSLDCTIPPVLAVATVLFGTKTGDNLTPPDIFTILTLVAVINEPLTAFLFSVPSLSHAIASFPRIQKFLCLEEQTDSRTTYSGSTSLRARNMSVQTDNSRIILQDVNLNIDSGDVIMISGPMGCGKTTLLQSFLGEVQVQGGTIECPPVPIAYSGQVTWLENKSIQDNICHGDYDGTRYRQVLAACALDQDMEALPLGDKTVIGTNAANVSSGQIQRVSLARAVYSGASVIVLDDPLSSVDDTTASVIMKRLLGEEGFLRVNRTTVIMTTSSSNHCSFADSVYAMSSEGTIQRLPGLAKDPRRRRTTRELVTAPQSGQGQVNEQRNTPKAITSKKAGSGGLTLQCTLDDNAENFMKIDHRVYSYYIGPAVASFTISFAVVSVVAVAERLAVIFMWFWQQEDPQNTSYFPWYATMALTKLIAGPASRMFFYKTFVPETSITFHKRLVNKLMGSTLSFLTETESGSILNRFSDDMSLIGYGLPVDISNSIYSIFTVCMDVAIISFSSFYAATMIPALVFVVYSVYHFYHRTSRQLRVRELEAAELLSTTITETASGVQYIRAFHWQARYLNRLQEQLDYSQIPAYTLLCVQRWLILATGLCKCAVAVTVVSLALKYPEKTDEHVIGLTMLILVYFSETLTLFVESFAGMEISLGAVARVKQFCEFVPQEEDSECDTDIPDHWPASGTIQFRGVSATYRIDGSSHEVLNNVSFTIGHGKKLGLSGRTGSGKSSIIAVLLRMVDYTGSILVDGRELRTVPRDIVRSRFLSLIQDGIQLKGSVRFNVDPYDPPDIESGNRLVDQTLIEALTRVGLWAKILAGGGLEAELDDLNLSKGQIQLLAIARAMVRRDYLLPKIVLIDEATSNTDNDTDRKLQTLFAEVFKHSTVIMISHRLYAFDKMHKVLMLDEGQIEDVLNRDPTSGLLVDR